VTRNTPAVRIALAAAILVFTLALVPGALAGKGKPGGGGGTSGATLTVSPTSVPSGGSFQAWGCGYTYGVQVNVVVNGPSSQVFFPTGVDTSGCIHTGAWTSEPGQYTVQTWQGTNRKQVLMASASLTVY
jgi:hypothetical protein